MIQPADHWFRMNRSGIQVLDRTRLGAILLEPEMRPILIIVSDVFLEHSPQVPFIEDNHMIEAVTAN